MNRRILEFKNWGNKKIALLHMNRSPNTIAHALQELDIPFDEFKQEEVKGLENKIHKYCGIIIGGGRLNEGEAPPNLPEYVEDPAFPVLGICLGNEILGIHLGSNLIDCNGGFNLGESSEVIARIEEDEIFDSLPMPSNQIVKMEHFYMLDKEPIGSKIIASTKQTPIAGFHHIEKAIWGLQFHPEKDMMKSIVFNNFYKICLK